MPIDPTSEQMKVTKETRHELIIFEMGKAVIVHSIKITKLILWHSDGFNFGNERIYVEHK